MSSLAANDRTVWIVGDPGEHLPKTEPRFHDGACYVLDQVGNRDRRNKVTLSDLPETYGPCKHCAPGGRTVGVAAANVGRHDPKPPEPRRGVQPGHTVTVEYLDVGTRLTVRIVSPQRARQPGEISTVSPLGKALLGKEIGAVVEFNVSRSAQQQRVRIVDFQAESD
jgi:hypothetical protein